MASSPVTKAKKSRPSTVSRSIAEIAAVVFLVAAISSFFLTEDSQLRHFVISKPEQQQQNFLRDGSQEGEIQRMDEPSSNKIKAISILGERNSGTTWIYEHLGECFNHSIPVHRRLTRYKHWFQDERVGFITKDTLAIAMFRNPFEWVEGMRKKPHHAPMHMYLPWEDFITRPWTMKRAGSDLTLDEEVKQKQFGCQEHFNFNDLISCEKRPYAEGFFKQATRYSEHQPFYEMRNDGSGEPFDNLLEMRAAKIRNFLSVVSYENVNKLMILQYEELLREGTDQLIRKIEELSGKMANCNPTPPQIRAHRKINSRLFHQLLDRIDWDAEKLIGYSATGIQTRKENCTIYKILS